MSAAVAQRIAIVGGGAAGTLTAIHLLREHRERGSLEIDLIDRDGDFGAGVAYGTADPLHLLNVPAVRMGAVSGHPEHFHEWLAGRGDAVAPEAFLPRGLYATYLRDLLAVAERDARGARLRRHHGEATAIVEYFGDTAAPLGVRLADGGRIWADRVVLAPGPLRAGDPVTVSPGLKESGVWIADPWKEGALEQARHSRSVLIVGTGLSMVDVALSLGRGPDGPRIRAVSRHGLVPRRHRRGLTNARRFHVPTESGTIEPMVAAVFAQICRVARQGDDWRDVIDSMRPATPALWKALRTEEKQRFLDQYQRLWDVHRFRMAPEVADRLEALLAAERLVTGAASIVSLEPHGRGARVYLRTPGVSGVEAVEVDRVIDCSGASFDLRRDSPPLLAGLLASGRARPDQLGLGLDIDEDGALLDRDGGPSDRLFTVGALRKGVEWEAVGITEIRDHAGVVARRILGAGSDGAVAILDEASLHEIREAAA
ncbi:MAG TPA: FAD/NAD(P)-binding protein [Solirubrobacterales bacterium]